MFTYKSFLLFIAFICGAIIMGIELVGSRVLSPFFGNSIFVWGSLISVFMGSLSLGYYFGGWYSDRKPELSKLAFIISFSALLLLIVPLISKPLNEAIYSLNMDVRYASLTASFILFFLPIAGLGVVSPYIIKMSTNSLSNVGVRAGSVYAISTMGSILGTILTSFYLISYLGVSTIFYLYGSILLVLSALMFVTDKLKIEKNEKKPDKIVYINTRKQAE